MPGGQGEDGWGGMRNAEDPSGTTKQMRGCAYAKSPCSEWRGTQDKQAGWDAGELSHAYGWTCSASKGLSAARADRESGRLRGKGRGGGVSPFRRLHANEHRRGCGVQLPSLPSRGLGGWSGSRLCSVAACNLGGWLGVQQCRP